MVESSPLLSAADGRKVTNAHRAIKFMILSAMASAVLVLLAASKSLEQTELIQWIVPKVHTASAVPLNQKMKYFYVQSSALGNDMKLRQQVVEVHTPQSVKLSPVFAPSPPHSQCVCFYPHDINQLQSRIKSQSLHVLEPNQTEAPKGTIRNCAISSLQLQANLVLHGWGICGYMLHPVSESGAKPTMGFITNLTDGPDSVISGPPNNTYCTPDKMNQAPCNTEWVRTLARNDPSSFVTCLGKIKGVSQTCAAFDSCGPRTQVPSSSGSNSYFSSAPPGQTKGVCSTPDFSYYKEFDILAMCGICDMFRATMTTSFTSPRAGFVEVAKKSAAGSLRASGLVGMAALVVAALAAAWATPM